MTTSNHKLPFLWKQLQKLYEKDQCYLRFSGFAIDLVQVHQKRIIFYFGLYSNGIVIDSKNITEWYKQTLNRGVFLAISNVRSIYYILKLCRLVKSVTRCITVVKDTIDYLMQESIQVNCKLTEHNLSYPFD